MSKPDLILRPHHGMCMAYFSGSGYSPEFVGRMRELITELQNTPVRLTLTDGCDFLCLCCPNHVGTEGCALGDNVLDFDREVLRLCGLRTGDELPAKEFFALVRENILRKGLRESICGSCRWSGLCTPDRMKLL